MRFDHESLAELLTAAGFLGEPQGTHVLMLDKPYDQLFAAYSATRRNQIRKCFKRGVTLRPAQSRSDVEQYMKIHEGLAERKGFRTRYPAELIYNLARLDQSVLVLAEVGDRVIAGALFFTDGNSMLYWHGGADENATEFFPMAALMDEGIQRAHRAGLDSFNFGGSPTESLATFKESFGSTARSNRTFHIRAPEPLAKRLTTAAKRGVRRLVQGQQLPRAW